MNPKLKAILDKVQVKSPEECEKADFVLCMESKPENERCRVKGSVDVACEGCGKMVMLAPTSPAKPPKMCLQCVIARLAVQKSFAE